MVMNKHKKNLDDLRRYLGRDTTGLALLDAVTRDLCEQRKLIASLEDANARASEQARNAQNERDGLHTQVARLKAELEREAAKRASADNRVRQQAERIAQLEADPGADVAGSYRGNKWDMARTLLNDVSRRFKTAPVPYGSSRTYHVSDLIVDCTGDEFMMLGKVMVLTAIVCGSVMLESEAQKRDDNWTDDQLRRLFRWMRPLIGETGIEKTLNTLLDQAAEKMHETELHRTDWSDDGRRLQRNES